MNLVITGVRSGLGKYLHDELGGIGLTRQNLEEETKRLQKNGVDIIVHCAANASRNVTSDSLYGFLEDNVLLTQRLTKIPHKKFIYLSSVDVYPKNGTEHQEDEVIPLDSLDNLYGVTKLMSESIVRKKCPNSLILRETAFLGKESRKNSLKRILEEEPCILSLSGDSVFNYICYSHMLDFIKLSVDQDLQGIYNLAASENITLSEVAEEFRKKPHFGTYRYDVGTISNQKTVKVLPALQRTSKEMIKDFCGVYS